MPRKKVLDAALLQAALQGLEQQKLELEKKITAVESMLGARKATAAAVPAKPKRTLSAAARKRIADAQKRRWAQVRAKAAKKSGKSTIAG